MLGGNHDVEQTVNAHQTVNADQIVVECDHESIDHGLGHPACLARLVRAVVTSVIECHRSIPSVRLPVGEHGVIHAISIDRDSSKRPNRRQ